MLLTTGQNEARTRWGTHVSGQVFDKKKVSYLTEEAQTFISEQTICVIAGHRSDNLAGGMLTLGLPGFAQALDEHTCLVALEGSVTDTVLFEYISQAQDRGDSASVSLFFQCHATRRRLCVHGTSEILTSPPPPSSAAANPRPHRWLCLHVTQAFFHCPKYIRTQVQGLTLAPVGTPDLTASLSHLRYLLQWNALSEPIQTYLASRILCYLCTVNRQGECGVNHRGGKAGFLVPLPPDEGYPQGTILLPDYAGNGAFEAIGNIMETGKAALLVPDYTAQMSLCFSGRASAHDIGELPLHLQHRCLGAERVIALSVRNIEGQYGDWSTPLTYECIRATSYRARQDKLRTMETYCPA